MPGVTPDLSHIWNGTTFFNGEMRKIIISWNLSSTLVSSDANIWIVLVYVEWFAPISIIQNVISIVKEDKITNRKIFTIQ